MAEIRIRKRKRKVWPWMMVLLIITAIVWLVVEAGEIGLDRLSLKEWRQKFHLKDFKLKDEGLNKSDYNGRLDEFIAYVNDIEFAGDIADEDKIKEGMRYLSGALDQVIAEMEMENEAIMADRKVLDEQLNSKHAKARTSSASLSSSDDIHHSIYTAANLIMLIQQAEFPELSAEADGVQRSAANIQPGVELQAQYEFVFDFFMKTVHALQSIRESIFGKLT